MFIYSGWRRFEFMEVCLLLDECLKRFEGQMELDICGLSGCSGPVSRSAPAWRFMAAETSADLFLETYCEGLNSFCATWDSWGLDTDGIFLFCWHVAPSSLLRVSSKWWRTRPTSSATKSNSGGGEVSQHELHTGSDPLSVEHAPLNHMLLLIIWQRGKPTILPANAWLCRTRTSTTPPSTGWLSGSPTGTSAVRSVPERLKLVGSRVF